MSASRSAKSAYRQIMERSASVREARGDGALYDYLVGLGVDQEDALEVFSLMDMFGLREGVGVFLDDYGAYYPILRKKRAHIEALAREEGY